MPTALPMPLELPMTPAHRVAVQHHTLRERRVFLGSIACFASFALVMLPVLAGPSSFAIGLVAAIGFVALGFGLDTLFWKRKANAVLAAGVFVRASGPIQVSNSTSDSTIRIGEQTVRAIPLSMGLSMHELPHGTVEYAPRVRLIFEQRDANEKVVYRYPSYRPEGKDEIGTGPRLWKGIAIGASIPVAMMLVVLGMAAALGPRT